MKNDETQKAWQMAVAVHADQTDKGGEQYMGHVLRVSNAVTQKIPFGTLLYDQLWTVAILHDVVEDVDYDQGGATREDIMEQISQEQSLSVVLAVQAITHEHWRSEPYLDYLARVKSDDLATAVKIADIRDNLSPDRMLKVLRNGSDRDFTRLTEVLTKRYIKALDYLS